MLAALVPARSTSPEARKAQKDWSAGIAPHLLFLPEPAAHIRTVESKDCVARSVAARLPLAGAGCGAQGERG